MAEHERANQHKNSDIEQKSRTKQQDSQPLFDRSLAWDTTPLSIRETPFYPRMDEHVAMLSKIPYYAQRRDFIMQLHQTYGNRYVQRLIKSINVQAKLTVNPSNDIYEQEADRVADVVTRSMTSQAQRQPEEEEEEVQTKSLLQRQPEEEVEEEVQTKSLLQREPAIVAENLETRINKARGNGHPLPDIVQKPMEKAFGADFSGVTVHTDAEADTLNQELSARAFTTGQDIFFRQGEYSPGSGSGQKLIAHELTHVVQQTGNEQLRRKFSKQRTSIATRKTTFGSRGRQRLFASAKVVESPNPFASVSKHSLAQSLTVSNSMVRTTLAQTKTSELTVQRLSGNLTVPSGDIKADWDGTRISKQFDMEATFSPETEQKYGEYRQYVKGYFSTPSGDISHNMGAAGMLDRKEYREDGPGQYGHRSDSDYDAADGKDIYNQPDRPTGKHFIGRDTPGLSPGGSGNYTMDLSFKGELIDTRDKSAFVTKYWHISRTVTKK